MLLLVRTSSPSSVPVFKLDCNKQLYFSNSEIQMEYVLVSFSEQEAFKLNIWGPFDVLQLLPNYQQKTLGCTTQSILNTQLKRLTSVDSGINADDLGPSECDQRHPKPFLLKCSLIPPNQ